MLAKFTRSRVRIGAAAMVAVMLAGASGCRDGRGSKHLLPAAEFLFSAGDSTYWVRSSEEGMRVRSAPILLTQVDDRLFEIFLTDDGAEYANASFATVRLWSRALGQRDSTLLFSDSTVMKELASWRSGNPGEREIDPSDDDVVDDPQTVVQDNVEVFDVHGPYLTFEHLLDVDINGGPSHIHTGRRYVVDVRTGRRMSLVDMLGDEEATRVIGAARSSMSQLVDSIRAAVSTGDERAVAAAGLLDGFVFDSSSFGIADISRDPAVAFMVPGNGPDGDAIALNIPPVAIAEPTWWKQVRKTLPEWSADSSEIHWKRDGYRVAAKLSPEADALSLMLSSSKGFNPRQWPVATVALPAYQLIALDSPPLDDRTRAALARAFDVSVALDGMAQRASYQVPTAPSAKQQAQLRVASLSHSITSTVSRLP